MEKPVAKISTKILYISVAAFLVVLFQLSIAWFPPLRDFYLFSFYPAMASFMRMLTGWCPFSIGDVLYILAGVWLLWGAVRFIRNLLQVRKKKYAWLITLLRFMLIALCGYGLFMGIWGLNYRYNRLYAQLGIRSEDFPTTALTALCDTLATRMNREHEILAGSDTLPTPHFLNFSQVIEKVPENYQRLAAEIPGLHYRFPSIKPSLFGYLINYAGITGYFNPFTGEGQINTTPMPVSLPFTTCHEVAHQLGFAKEEDANFVGYLVAATSPDPYFRYAAHFEMFLYGINVLSFREPVMADSLWNTLITKGVRKDYDTDFAFYDKFRTSIRPILNEFYDQYLKANEQSKGIRSYNDVVSLLINYMAQKGKLPG
jgi:hypothetical protein